jgi:hypothetical protein
MEFTGLEVWVGIVGFRMEKERRGKFDEVDNLDN